MEIAIRYFTKSKKGNTEKLANVVSKALNIEALDVSKDLEEKADKLILINAMYAADIDKEVKEFLERNKDKIGEIFNMNTSASGSSTWKNVVERRNLSGTDDGFFSEIFAGMTTDYERSDTLLAG